jgi:hypothetical protein
VDVISERDVTEADARHAGFATRANLFADLPADPKASLYRIRLRFAGEDPRIALRENAAVSDADVAEIQRRLARLDAASKSWPWTHVSLAAIANCPERAAAELALSVKRDKEWLKANVRKLKELGLTESLQPGYRSSPRGRKFLALVPPIST